MSDRPRDAQRKHAYAAENDAFSAERRVLLPTMFHVNDYVRRTASAKWTVRMFGPRYFRVADGRGTTNARGGGSWLNLPKWARSEPVILHEMAHCYAPSDARHTWAWAAVYLQLVRHFMGTAAHAKLRAAFKAHRVRYKKPRELD